MSPTITHLHPHLLFHHHPPLLSLTLRPSPTSTLSHSPTIIHLCPVSLSHHHPHLPCLTLPSSPTSTLSYCPTIIHRNQQNTPALSHHHPTSHNRRQFWNNDKIYGYVYRRNRFWPLSSFLLFLLLSSSSPHFPLSPSLLFLHDHLFFSFFLFPLYCCMLPVSLPELYYSYL